MTAEITVVLGTRPEIIKLAPVIHACSEYDFSCTVVHTGQHYSENLDSVFFEQLSLPEPDYHLGVGSGRHGEQTGKMIIELEGVLRKDTPEVVLVQGDTNSVLAGAIVASKLDVELGHVEAGLRSFDREMPEEVNRVVTDHVSEYLFAPTERSKENLLAEGVPESQITVTGNTVVDALHRNRQVAQRKSSTLQELDLEDQRFFLLTLHRQENVDDEERFRKLLVGVGLAADEHDVSVVYPIHPRARKRLDEFDVDLPDPVRLVEPREYLDFLRLQDEAALILTDSGGVQEEACVLGTPCVTLRDSTERPETVEVGANVVAGHNPTTILGCVDRMYARKGDWQNPFGDGNAAERILRTVIPQGRRVSL